MSDKKDDPTLMDPTLLEHVRPVRVPSASEVHTAVDAVPTVEDRQRPDIPVPSYLQSPAVRVHAPSAAAGPVNPTIPVSPVRGFDVHPTSPTLPGVGFTDGPSQEPTIKEAAVRRPVPEASNRLVPLLAAALIVALGVIVLLLLR